MKGIDNLPVGDKRLENDFNDCIRRKRFIECEKSTAPQYIDRAKTDFLSAQREYKNGDIHWVIIKSCDVRLMPF